MCDIIKQSIDRADLICVYHHHKSPSRHNALLKYNVLMTAMARLD